MKVKESLIAGHQAIATKRWFDLEFIPLLKDLRFKPSTAKVILDGAARETTRWEPVK